MKIINDAVPFILRNTIISADRLEVLKDLVSRSKTILGNIAEVGVFKGGSSYLLAALNPEKTVFIFDTFEGMPEPSLEDNCHRKGDFYQNIDYVRGLLSGFDNVKIFKGIFPIGSQAVEKEVFSLVHIDVDIYKSTLDCFKFFYPRTSKGGIIVCDDYNASSCLGAKKAVDEFMKDKPEILCSGESCQIYVIKE